MVKLNRFLEDYFWPERESRLRKLILAPLYLLSFFYGGAVRARAFLYRMGILESQSLPCKVVSVGNITVGGTGKTPFTCLLAEMMQKRGLRVAVLSRGYKGTFTEPFRVVSDGQRILMEPREAGDEPYLLARKLAGVPVIVGRKRVQSGRYAVQKFNPEVILLDDGFQHLALRRDLDFLLIDSAVQFGNQTCLPRGVLREPLSHLSRADAFILTKVEQSNNINNLKEKLDTWAQGRPTFGVAYVPEKILKAGDGDMLPAQELEGKKVLAFCGIARPESFRSMLRKLNASIAHLEIFPDHYRYADRDWSNLVQKAEQLGVEALLTTEKDWTRLADSGMSSSIPLWVLCIRHVFPESGGRERFEDFLFSRLGLTT